MGCRYPEPQNLFIQLAPPAFRTQQRCNQFMHFAQMQVTFFCVLLFVLRPDCSMLLCWSGTHYTDQAVFKLTVISYICLWGAGITGV